MNTKLENALGCVTTLLFLISPFVFVKSLFDFADLPQTAFIQLGALVLLLMWCAKAVIEGEVKLSGNLIGFIIIAFLIWSFVSLIWARNRYEGLLPLIHLSTCAAFFFLATNCLHKNKWINGIILAILASGTGISLLGCAQYIFKLDWIPQAVPPAATFGHRNIASQFVSMILPVVPAVFFYTPQKYLRFLLGFAASVSLLYLFFSETRAGWAAIMVAIFFVLAALIRDARAKDSLVRVSKKMIGAFFILISVFTLTLVLLHPGFYQSISDISKRAFRHEVLVGTADGHTETLYNDTMEVRLAIWENTLEMIKDRPIAGFGIGNYKVFYPVYHQSDKVFSEEIQLRTAHNDYLQTAVELGLVGFLLFLGLPAAPFIMAFRLISPRKPPEVRLMVIGLIGGIIGFLVQAVFSFPMERAMPPLIFFTYLAFLTIFYNRHVSKKGPLLVKIPRGVGILLFIALATAGFMLTRFNLCNILSDRYYRLALISEKRGAWPETISAGLKSLEYNPYQMNALSSVGRAYMESNQALKGIDALEETLEAYPYSINAMVNLAVAYHKAGDKDKAIETFRQVLEIKPDYPRALANMGKIYMKDKDYDNALKHFTKALKYDKKNVRLHANIGFLYFRQGRYDKAAKEYELVLRYQPELAFAHKALGMIYHKHLKQPEKALYHIQKYREMKPADQASGKF